MRAQITSFLDEGYNLFQQGKFTLGVEILAHEIIEIKKNTSDEEWKLVVKRCRAHKVQGFILQDPFARRILEKPRGFPGDSEMLEFIYRYENDVVSELALQQYDNATETGKEFNKIFALSPGGLAVLQRRQMILQEMTNLAQLNPKLNILAFACGYLTEAQLSRVVLEHRFDEFIASDQDTESLEYIQETVGIYGVIPRRISVSNVIKRATTLGNHHLIYSLGLYDYLHSRLASRLTKELFSLLKPGGKLLVANFTHKNNLSAFMEAFVDWTLIHRSLEEIDALAGEINQCEIYDKKIIETPNGVVAFLEITKKS